MTFIAFETSQASGEPIELYEFVLGLQVLRFTSSEDVFTYIGNEYTPVALQRSSLLFTGELQQDAITITMPSSDAFPSLYTDFAPSQKASLTVRRLHRVDGDLQAILMFKGIVRTVSFSKDASEAQITVVPLSGNLARNIPRYTFQALCNHFLFDQGCKIVPALFQYDGTVSVDNEFIITVPGLEAAKGDGWATGGFVQMGVTDYRMVLLQDGDDLTIILPFGGNVAGQDVSVFAGCARTIAVCKSKFDNVINYGGWAFVPTEDIFSVGLD